MVKEIIRISYYRRLSSLVASYKVRVIAYYFHSAKILTKYTDLGTIAITDKELYNLTTIGVDTTINLNAEA
jgi:hypothetical protein